MLYPHIPGNRIGHSPRNNQATSPETSGITNLDCNLGRKEIVLKAEPEIPCGKLQHACKVVKLGSTLLRRIFEVLRVVA